ncbi:MAG: DUF885 domain-containing protein [Planctomycetales bacterium]|nr:DUF885 domain-containing protein [Planctomycetales bacterium]
MNSSLNSRTIVIPRLASVLLAVAFVGTQPLSAQNSDAELARIFADYHEQYLILFPVEATNFGDSRYNGLLQIDISEDFIARESQFYQSIQQRLQKVELETASPQLQLMAEILDYELNMRLTKLQFGFERIPFQQFGGLPLTFAQMGSGSSSQPFKTVADYDQWLQRCSAFKVWADVSIERFRQGIDTGYVLPSILVERMVTQMLDPTIVTEDPTKSLFYQPVEKFPDAFDDEVRTRLAQAYEQAIAGVLVPTYRRLGEFLRDEYLPKSRNSAGISSLENGRQQYLFWVKYWTTTELTPDEIFQIGQQEVERIRNEMNVVKGEMKFAGSLPEFFDYLRTDPRFKPFSSADEVIGFFHDIQKRLEPNLARAFQTTPKTPFEIRRTESFREKTASAEYMPGSADGSRPGIFYCPIPDVREYNITGGMESLFLHEALPGHHYQISLQQENTLLPEFAKFLWYGAYGEGWALYCESIGNELGLYQDPEQKIGALGDEMHRAIRLVVDVGIHWKGWTRDQAIEYMMDNEPISRDGAVAEIERYMAYAGQALSYKIGQLKISELRQSCEDRLGDRFSLAEFHDQVLMNGCMPLSILQRRLSAWRPD